LDEVYRSLYFPAASSLLYFILYARLFCYVFFTTVDTWLITTYNLHFDRVYQLNILKSEVQMSEMKATVKTLNGMVVSVHGFPYGQIAKGTNEETAIAYAMTGGWKLTKVSPSEDESQERVLTFLHDGDEKEYLAVEVLIAQYERGALTNLWSTTEKYYNRTRFLGERSHEAPIFLARDGWVQITAVKGRAYYVRSPKKAVTSAYEAYTEMYV
jgi:hypothetical protein